jgi:hypothetical protein
VMQEAVVPARNGHVKNLLSRQARTPGEVKLHASLPDRQNNDVETTMYDEGAEVGTLSKWVRNWTVTHHGTHTTRSAIAATHRSGPDLRELRRSPTLPPAIVNNLGRSHPNQEHYQAYQPHFEWVTPSQTAAAQIRYHLAIASARGPQYEIVRILKV